VAAAPVVPIPDATAVLPQTGAPVARPAPVPTPRLDQPAAYEGGPPARRRSAWPVVLLVLLLVAAAIAVAAVMLNSGDDETPSRDGGPTTRSSRTEKSSATTESTPTEPTTPTTTADETVEVNADDYVGRDRFDVEADLERMGLKVRFDEDTNPGGETEDIVTSLNPTGTLDVGDTVDVHFWGPEPTTPSTSAETTTPSDTASTDTGSSIATEGGTG
jgi:hypothetical protein